MFSINEFRSSINNQGILRSNRYIATFKIPNYLRQRYRYDTKDTNLLSLRCENVSLPGFDFLSADGPPRMGYGAVEKHPYVPGFSGLSLTFILDSKSRIYNFFYDWTMTIVNYNGKGGTNYNNPNGGWSAYEVGYKKDYQSEIDIKVYDGNKSEKSISIAGNEIFGVKLYSAYPVGMPSVPLAWDSPDIMRMTVPFSYTDFEIIR